MKKLPGLGLDLLTVDEVTRVLVGHTSVDRPQRCGQSDANEELGNVFNFCLKPAGSGAYAGSSLSMCA